MMGRKKKIGPIVFGIVFLVWGIFALVVVFIEQDWKLAMNAVILLVLGGMCLFMGISWPQTPDPPAGRKGEEER